MTPRSMGASVMRAAAAVLMCTMLAACPDNPVGSGGGGGTGGGGGGPRSINQPFCSLASFSASESQSQLLPSFGGPQYDTPFAQEVAIQRQFYNGIPATVYIYGDGGPSTANALSSPGGTILFGYYMFHRTIQTYGGLAVAGVLAHEWGHQVQFDLGYSNQYSTPVIELEADAFSGFYMALAKAWAWSQIQGYFANTYALGDYYFNSSGHHGTPNQRVAAAYMGVQLAAYVVQLGRPVTYAEVHGAFMQGMPQILAYPVRVAPSARPRPEIASLIDDLPLSEIAAGRQRGADVRQPAISAEARSELFPRLTPL